VEYFVGRGLLDGVLIIVGVWEVNRSHKSSEKQKQEMKCQKSHVKDSEKTTELLQKEV